MSANALWMRAAERHEIHLGRTPRQHVAVRELAHRRVAHQRPAVGARDANRERVRAGERRAAFGVAETSREVAASAATSPPMASRRTQ